MTTKDMLQDPKTGHWITKKYWPFAKFSGAMTAIKMFGYF
jgi:hypothetical protein